MNALPPVVYLLFTLAVFTIAGGLLVWVIGYVSGSDKKSSKEREQPLTTVAPGELEPPVLTGEQELLRVSRTKKGELVVFVQGQRHRHLREITDLQMRGETIEALKAMLTFAEGWLPSTRKQIAPSTPAAPAADQAEFLSQLRQPPPPSSAKPPGLLSGLQTLQARSPDGMLDPLSLVDEIDNLVQQRLQERPDLADRQVRLTTGVAGGLCIYVGQQAFDAVDDISDPQVKALIQDAIQEWEGD